jgi:hypothetical protein
MNKAKIVPFSKRKPPQSEGGEHPVDAKEMGRRLGWTPQYIHELANTGVIPWVGRLNGKKKHKRFFPSQVTAALAQGGKHESA